MLKTYVILWSLLLVSIVVSAQDTDKVISQITVEPTGTSRVAISGLCTNHSSQSKELKYVLRVQKSSRSGNTNNNNQSGNFFIESEQSKKLSTTTLNFEPENHIEIVLTIFDSEHIQIAQHKKTLTKTDFLK